MGTGNEVVIVEVGPKCAVPGMQILREGETDILRAGLEVMVAAGAEFDPPTTIVESRANVKEDVVVTREMTIPGGGGRGALAKGSDIAEEGIIVPKSGAVRAPTRTVTKIMTEIIMAKTEISMAEQWMISMW